MMEHIEPWYCSGDSYAVLPTFDLSGTRQQMIDITNKIAIALETVD